MFYIALDPSGDFTTGKGTTGISTMFDNDWDTLEVSQIKAKNFESRHEYWKAIMTNIYIGIHDAVVLKGIPKNKVVVIIESFTVRNNGFTLGKMPETIMLIGAIVYYLEKLKIKTVFQTPGAVKSRFKDDLLLKHIPNLSKVNEKYLLNGKPTNDHIRDSMKHLLFYIRYGDKNE